MHIKELKIFIDLLFEILDLILRSTLPSLTYMILNLILKLLKIVIIYYIDKHVDKTTKHE